LQHTFERYPLSGIGKNILLHALSFCSRPDALTQWRGYSVDGGFAIGVDFQHLFHRAQASEFAIARMMYEHAAQRDIIERTINHAIELFDKALPRLQAFEPEEATEIMNGLILQVRMSLIHAAFHFKNEAFKSEEEWRVFTLDQAD